MRPMRRITILGAIGIALLLGCNAAGTQLGPRPGLEAEHRVLFVGNSLTYYNELPFVVERLAALNGESLLASSVTAPGWSLEDHWADGTAADSIATRHFTLVVLQQGPSALESSRVLLRDFARRFDTVIRERGATSALYAVWPSSDRAFDFDRVHESYSLAATDVGGTLFPVGEGWRAAWRIQPDLRLWSPDGLHPTAAATYLAALVMHARIFGQAAEIAPDQLVLATGSVLTISARDLATIRAAAAEVTR